MFQVCTSPQPSLLEDEPEENDIEDKSGGKPGDYVHEESWDTLIDVEEDETDSA
jgi:hypothetical protein